MTDGSSDHTKQQTVVPIFFSNITIWLVLPSVKIGWVAVYKFAHMKYGDEAVT